MGYVKCYLRRCRSEALDEHPRCMRHHLDWWLSGGCEGHRRTELSYEIPNVRRSHYTRSRRSRRHTRGREP